MSVKATRVFALTLLASAFAAGCSDPPPPPPPPVVKPADPPKPPPAKPTKPNMAPPLSAAQKTELETAFKAARELAKQADTAKAEAMMLEKSQGRQAANATYVKAKKLYASAIASVSDWLDGDLAQPPKVTDAQVTDYLGSYANEVHKWQASNSDIGKVHEDE
jgi:hypothetical protein